MIAKRTGILSIQTNCIDTVKNGTRNMKRLFVVSDIIRNLKMQKKRKSGHPAWGGMAE